MALANDSGWLVATTGLFGVKLSAALESYPPNPERHATPAVTPCITDCDEVAFVREILG